MAEAEAADRRVGAQSDELSDLLRRSHRQELVDLARVLGVAEGKLGLGDLARGLEKTIRRRGANDIVNLFVRGGEGPPYEQVVRGLAKRMGVDETGPVPAVEQAVLDAWIERHWDALDDDQRATVWQELEIQPPIPADGHAALTEVKNSLGGSYGYVVGYTVVGIIGRVMMFTPLAPVAGCAALWYVARPRDDVLLPAVMQVARLRQALRHRVTVGVVGSPSSGKDAAIQALFGVQTGNVNPVAGSTKTVEINRLPGATALYVVNTPGMGDVVEQVTEEAKQVLGLIDVYLYVVNAQGGVQAREKADYDACRATGRPVLAVVNKVDTLRESDRERYLVDARAKLNAPERDFAAVAFDPLPQLSEHPIGVQQVRDWIRRALVEQGKSPDELGLLSDDDLDGSALGGGGHGDGKPEVALEGRDEA